MHNAKNRGNKVIPLAILAKILAQSCVTPLPYIRVTLVSCMVHPIPTSPLIRFLHLFNIFLMVRSRKPSYAHAYMRRSAHAALSRRACATRVTVVGSVSVCVSVCYSTFRFSNVYSSHKRYHLLNGQ